MTKWMPRASFSPKGGLSANLLSEDDLQAIHVASLRIMSTTGVKFYNEEALKVLKQGGCEVDFSEQLAKIPEYIVEDAITSAPSTVTLYSRDGKHDIPLESSRVAFTNFGAGIKIYDPFSGELRLPTTEDLANTAKVVDYCDAIDVYSQAVVPRSADAEGNEDLVGANAFLNNTTKHCHHIDLGSGVAAERFIRMGAAIAGGMDKLRERPILSALICPTSPLQMSAHGSAIIMEFARHGIPINILSMALAGATTPLPVAGTLVTHNCEVLAGIVLAQLTNKGAPCIYGSSTTSFDMHCMTAPVGSAELGLINCAVGLMADRYNLPSYTAGG